MRVLNEKIDTAVIDALRPHPRNPRRGDLNAIQQSINVNGFYGAIVAQKSTGYILAGNHRWEAALSNGAKEIPVIWVDVDDDHALRILLADNRTNDLAEYDNDLLTELLNDLAETTGTLDGTGYGVEDVEKLLSEIGIDELSNADKSEPDPDSSEALLDEGEDLRNKWGTERGQLWQIGNHRLLCDDSTDPAVIERLVGDADISMIWTDPPYGVSVVKSEMVGADFGVAKKGKYQPIIGDNTTETAVKAYALAAERFKDATQIWWGGNYYADKLPPSSCWLVWDKRADSGIENTFADAELAWTNLTQPVRVYRQLWNGMIREGEHTKRVHPTQKPEGLARWCYERYTESGAAILDLFLGSGVAIVAAEQTDRTCYGVELSPEYAAIILERLQSIGLEPELIESE